MFFATSMVGIPITAFILFLGMGMTGAGHGTYGMWYFGLLLSFICWLFVGASVITGFIAWRREARIVWWAIPEAILFIVLTLLGLWGMQG
jgi:hypothetical protein